MAACVAEEGAGLVTARKQRERKGTGPEAVQGQAPVAYILLPHASCLQFPAPLKVAALGTKP